MNNVNTARITVGSTEPLNLVGCPCARLGEATPGLETKDGISCACGLPFARWVGAVGEDGKRLAEWVHTGPTPTAPDPRAGPWTGVLVLERLRATEKTRAYNQHPSIAQRLTREGVPATEAAAAELVFNETRGSGQKHEIGCWYAFDSELEAVARSLNTAGVDLPPAGPGRDPVSAGQVDAEAPGSCSKCGRPLTSEGRRLCPCPGEEHRESARDRREVAASKTDPYQLAIIDRLDRDAGRGHISKDLDEATELARCELEMQRGVKAVAERKIARIEAALADARAPGVGRG